MDSSVIATFLNKQLFGSNIEVTKFSSLSELNDNCVVFCKKYSVDLARVLNEHKVIFAIVTPEYEGKIAVSYTHLDVYKRQTYYNAVLVDVKGMYRDRIHELKYWSL